MGLGILKFKFNNFLWIIVIGMMVMIVSFLFFMTLIYKATKENEQLTFDSIDMVSYGFVVSKASDYLTAQARVYAATGNKEYYDNYWNEVNSNKTRDKAIDALVKLQIPANILSYAEQAKNSSDSLIKLEEASFEAVAAGDLQKATQIMSSKEYESGKEKISAFLTTFENEIKAFSANEAKKSASETVTIIIMSLICIASVAVLFLIFLSFFISSLKKALNILDKLFICIADGDMTVKAPELAGKSEICTTFKNINISLESIREILQNVTEATEDVASSNNQLASTMEELSSTFSEQAHQVSDTAVSLDSINSTVKGTVDSLKSNQEIVDNTVISANDGKKELTDLKLSMEKIHTDADSLSDTITNLANSSSEIGNIVTVINDIAEQTNLLALNAAIEAARAGEAGRGFAVVADEVRKLAERTQHATGKIESIIGSLQQKSNLASVEMTKSVESVQAGVDNIGETNEGFKSAVESVMDLHREMKTVAESVSNQYSTILTVVDNTQVIAAGIEESNQAVSEVNRTVAHLQERTDGLKMLISKFNV